MWKWHTSCCLPTVTVFTSPTEVFPLVLLNMPLLFGWIKDILSITQYLPTMVEYKMDSETYSGLLIKLMVHNMLTGTTIDCGMQQLVMTSPFAGCSNL